jgi:OmcA/MtrC family decaheme c-type cytochrome
VPFNWHAVSPTDTYADVTYPGVLNMCTQCHVAGGYDFSLGAVQTAVPNMLPSTVATGLFNGSATTNPTGYFSISPYVKADNATNYGWGYSTSNVTRTLPDGLSGTQVIGGVTANCTPAAPCTCTATNPCTQAVGTTFAFYNTTSTVVKSDGTGTPVCTDASPCTCVTNPASGAKTSCTATFATCSATAPCEAQGTTLVKSPIVSACSACHDTEAAISHMQTNGGSFYEPRSVYAAKTEQCLICHGPGTAGDISMAHMGI